MIDAGLDGIPKNLHIADTPASQDEAGADDYLGKNTHSPTLPQRVGNPQRNYDCPEDRCGRKGGLFSMCL